MYCEECGHELPDGAEFCPDCGTKVEPELSSGTENPSVQATRSRRTVGDTVTDTLASKISGKDIHTTDISLEDMVSQVTEHFVKAAKTDDERKKLRKTLKGTLLIGRLGQFAKSMDSADGKYSLSVLATYVPGYQLLQFRIYNWITIQEKGTGAVYQYKAINWGKFSKEISAVMDKYWT